MFFNRCCRQPQMMGGFGNNQSCMEQQVVEPTITKCVEKEFYHEVPQV